MDNGAIASHLGRRIIRSSNVFNRVIDCLIETRMTNNCGGDGKQNEAIVEQDVCCDK